MPAVLNLTDEEKRRSIGIFNSSVAQHDDDFLRFCQPRIVIIGAGAAGLSAAQHLIANDFTNIIILEAQDRTGGRVWSQKIDGGHIEMGAQFLHGKNILYDVAEQNKLIKIITPHKKKDVDPLSEHGSGGEFLVDADLEMTPLLKDIFTETYNTITKMFAQCKYNRTALQNGEKQSIGRFLNEQFELFIAEKTKNNNETDEIKAFRLSIFGWLLRCHRQDNACQSLHDLSISDYAKYAGSLECIPVTVPMADILKLCVSKVPASKILLKKAVQQIRFNEELGQPIQVVCEDGDVFVADHCIVTSSLGFLKQNSHKFFNPGLSENKLSAIAQAGFGTVNKIFLRFDRAFWEEKFGATDGFQLLFMDAADSECRLLDRPWYRALMGFDVCKTLPNTLVGWICGTHAESMELLTDDEISDTCQILLQQFLKGVTVPRPVGVLRPNWRHNQYVCGSFSYAAKNQADHIEMLAQPTWYYRSASDMLQHQIPALLFAGEATHSTLFSTVPGALESGQREADRIIVLYTKS